eukprot:g16054.t1
MKTFTFLTGTAGFGFPTGDFIWAATGSRIDIDISAAYFSSEAYLDDDAGAFSPRKIVDAADEDSFGQNGSSGTQQQEQQENKMWVPWVVSDVYGAGFEAFDEDAKPALGQSSAAYVEDSGESVPREEEHPSSLEAECDAAAEPEATTANPEPNKLERFDPEKLPLERKVKHSPTWLQQSHYEADFEILQAMHKTERTATTLLSGNHLHHVILIGRNKKFSRVLFIAFRGTANFTSDFVHSDARPSGFANKYEATRLELLALVQRMFVDGWGEVSGEGMRDAIETIVFTGHSLGGAVARIAAADAKIMMMEEREWEEATASGGADRDETEKAVEQQIRECYKTDPYAADVFVEVKTSAPVAQVVDHAVGADVDTEKEAPRKKQADERKEVQECGRAPATSAHSVQPRWDPNNDDRGPLLARRHWKGFT